MAIIENFFENEEFEKYETFNVTHCMNSRSIEKTGKIHFRKPNTVFLLKGPISREENAREFVKVEDDKLRVKKSNNSLAENEEEKYLKKIYGYSLRRLLVIPYQVFDEIIDEYAEKYSNDGEEMRKIYRTTVDACVEKIKNQLIDSENQGLDLSEAVPVASTTFNNEIMSIIRIIRPSLYSIMIDFLNESRSYIAINFYIEELEMHSFSIFNLKNLGEDTKYYENVYDLLNCVTFVHMLEEELKKEEEKIKNGEKAKNEEEIRNLKLDLEYYYNNLKLLREFTQYRKTILTSSESTPSEDLFIFFYNIELTESEYNKVKEN